MRRGLVALSFAALVGLAASARADPTPQERALADTLFTAAKSLVAAGNFSAACPKFAESQRLDPHVGTLLYLATCHQQEGKTASAWVEFNDAAHAAHAAGQSERESLAKSRANALAPKLARVNVRVPKPTFALEVTVDGITLDASAWGTPFPVDPGPHAVGAKAPKHVAWTSTVTAEASHAIEIVVPELADEAPPVAPPAAQAPAKRDGVVDSPPAKGHGRALGFVALGVGGAGLVVGSIAGIVAIDTNHSASKLGDNGGCKGDRCTQPVLDKESDARTMGWVSTAAFGVGVLGAGIGTWLLLTSHEEPESRVLFAPSLGPRTAGLSAVGSF